MYRFLWLTHYLNIHTISHSRYLCAILCYIGTHSTPQTARARLPALAMAEDLKAQIASNRVLLITGETGCGKTTQLPQIILEDAVQRLADRR